MFKISNQTQIQSQSLADFPIHTMKKDLEEIDHPSESKKNEPESQERYILNDTQKSSPFLSSASQPKQVAASIKFKDEAVEQRISDDRLTRQQAEEGRIAEQKAEMARKIAEEKRITEQKAMEERLAKQKAEAEKMAMKQAEEKKLAEQKATMAQKVTEENAARERRIAEQRAKPISAPTAPAPIKVVAPANTDTDKIKMLEKSSGTSKPKTITYLIVSMILVLLIAGGGYYFWITRQQNEPVVIVPDPIPEPEPEPKPEPSPSIAFSTNKPNYLIIEPVSPTAGEIKIALKKYTDDVANAGITVPVEFIVVDAQNNPIIFSTFANNLGLTLSPAIMSNLADIFSLFIYSDQGNIRLGLAIDSKNDNLLKTTMLAEEKNIIAKISPLFMDVVFTSPSSVSFNKYTYNEIELHYINSISSYPLSVDYGILNKKLLISTSKETTFAIVDYIKNSGTNTIE